VAKKETVGQSMAKLEERIRGLENREPSQAMQRLNEVESKLPRKVVKEPHEGAGWVGWDEERDRFMAGWLRDHMSVLTGWLAVNLPEVPKPELSPLAKNVAGFALVLTVAFGIFGYLKYEGLRQDMLRQQAFGREVWNQLATKPSRAELSSPAGVAQGGTGDNAWNSATTTSTAIPNAAHCLSGDVGSPIITGAAGCGAILPPSHLATTVNSAPKPCNVSEEICHGLALELTANCWLRITEETPEAKVWVDGNQKNGYTFNRTFPEGASIEVRNGCPGKVYYNVNGIPSHPDNVSGTPDKSEVVDLRL
jgi:hypothetical protein